MVEYPWFRVVDDKSFAPITWIFYVLPTPVVQLNQDFKTQSVNTITLETRYLDWVALLFCLRVYYN